MAVAFKCRGYGIMRATLSTKDKCEMVKHDFVVGPAILIKKDALKNMGVIITP